MSKPKGDKRQGQRAKRQARAARGKETPGILQSWEDFSQDAMGEYLEAVVEDLGEQLDAFEQALRSEN